MKLRIRCNRVTKTLTVSDENLSFSSLKSKITEELSSDLGLRLNQEFQISLDGKRSAGDDESLVKDAGIVSGDLLKIIYDGALPSTSVSSSSCDPGTSGVAEPSVNANTSHMSVTCNSDIEPSSSGENLSAEVMVDDIPCMSPGPIFFQDCDVTLSVPHLLQQVYENDAVRSEFQAMCLVLHIMMCESGFYIEGHTSYEDVIPLLHATVFIAEYSHPAGANLKFNMTCSPVGPFILVNGVTQPCQNTSEQVLTLQIKTNDHITSFNASNKNSNAAAVYKNLSKLSRIFKEIISHPALNNMREELQLPPVHGLLSLFPELLLRICSNLNCKSLIALSQVCKALSLITNDETLWRNLYIKDFKSHPANVGGSWKKTYAKRFVQEKERRAHLEQMYRDSRNIDPWSQFPPQGFPTPVPLPEAPIGIIGGDYDLNPTFPYGPFANQPRNPRRFPPTRPVHPSHPDNPLPGSRFDPIYPGGGFRPGRGGGMIDEFSGLGNSNLFQPGLGNSNLFQPGLGNSNRFQPGLGRGGRRNRNQFGFM